ncbi:MAG TPA: phytoene desaturase family protein [Nannocystaceae bacterium]|nr:phytoene desaturase family protein [Nannocystaceae bacterium]
MAETTWDVVVVGAGVGGLATALRVAASGHSTLVVERHHRVGGKMAQAHPAGVGVDCGPTVLTMRDVFDDLFAAAGERLDEHVRLRQHELIARHAWPDGSRLDLHGDIDRTAADIAAFAGSRDAQGYRRFCQHGAALLERLDPALLREPNDGLFALTRRLGASGMLRLSQVDWRRTLWEALPEFFEDPRLRQLFARYATYCGSSPFAAPATLSLIAEVERRGVWSLEGGMIALADALARAIERHGGRIALGEGVVELRASAGRVHTVTLSDGTTLRPRCVVFNGDPAALRDGSLGADVRHAVEAGPGPRSLSAMTWSMLAAPSGFELAYHNVFFSADYRSEFDALFERRQLPESPSVYVCASDRWSTTPAGAERLFCLTNAPADPELGAETEPICRERMERSLRACGLELAVVATEHRSPRDFAARFPASAGALYGSATHGAMSAWRRVKARTKLANLWLVGGTVHPGAGVPMAALSGTIAARQVLADLRSTSGSRTAATAGGTSTASRPMKPARSR